MIISDFLPFLWFCLQGFCLSFLTQLDRASHPVVENLICQHVLGKSNVKSILKQPIPEPLDGGKYLQFEGYWLSVGTLEPEVPEGYILTPSVRANLRDLARVVSAGYASLILFIQTTI
jgi:midasin